MSRRTLDALALCAPLSLALVGLIGCADRPGKAAVAVPAPSTPATPSASSAPSAASAGSEPTAHSPSKSIGVTLGRENIECDEQRCSGTFSRGAIEFESIDPQTRIRYGGAPETALIDRGPKSRPRYRVEAPNLDSVFETLNPAELTQGNFDASVVTRLELTLIFSDGAQAKTLIPLSRTGARLAFFERMEAATKGPVRFPSDDEAKAAPRAMWVPFPAGIRGSARSISEIDWVLVLDQPSRSIECERSSGGLGQPRGAKVEKAAFSISDERARVYERRSGRLLGEKVLPSDDAQSCAQFFQWRDEDVGGVVSMRDRSVPTQLADWAWNTLRTP